MFQYVSKLYIAGVVVILFAISIGIFFVTQYPVAPTFEPKKLLTQINTSDTIPDFLEIENIVGEAMKTHGTRAGFEVIDAGEELGLIDNDACHGLLHYVGHVAYAQFPNDYQKLLGIVEGTDCIGGYLHGIEAEIVLGSSNVIDDIQAFCTFQKERGVNPGACYHGVGHAATELYNYDVPKSLALCDALKGPMEEDLTNCYRGVFSEVGNAATGNDGHTGLVAEIREIKNLNPEKPLLYCETFAQIYQSSCKSQILKVAQIDMKMDDWLSVCLDDSLSDSSQNICVNISVGVYVRHHLSFEESAFLPPRFEELPLSQQKIGILGAAEAFSGYFADNKEKSWVSFCTSAPDEIKSYCSEILSRSENGEAPWMERTDIR